LLVDGRVVWPEDGGGARLALLFGNELIARDLDTVAFGEYRPRIGNSPIAVDNQPRLAPEHRRSVQTLSEAAGNVGDADVIGDVQIQLRRVEAEVPVTRRDISTGVIADD
jgi:hypothetical protein